MAIVAKIDIYDDETGKYYAKDYVMPPTKTDKSYEDLSMGYFFGFHIRIREEKEIEDGKENPRNV